MKNECKMWNGVKVFMCKACDKFQDFCDEVFGKEEVKVSYSDMNAVTAHFLVKGGTDGFKDHLRKRLLRLKDKFEDTYEYEDLIFAVERLGLSQECEQAYAQLAAWDLLMEDLEDGLVEMTSYGVDTLKKLPHDGNPFETAEEVDEMVLEDFHREIMDEDNNHFVVLVRAPWNRSDGDNPVAEALYYRSLARRSFMHAMNSEVSRALAGIVIIEETIVDGEVKVTCHGFCNPNCSQIDDRDYEIVKALAGKGDERGIFEDFEYDNY